MNKICQRQWIAIYVTHKDRTFQPLEHPAQILFGQFTSQHTYYAYNYKMFTDCEDVVQIDRQLYGWDSAWAVHDYRRDLKGHLNWTVSLQSGPKVMDMKVHMPYGLPQLFKDMAQSLLEYGTSVGVTMGKEIPDTNALRNFLTQASFDFHWVTEPGVSNITASANYTPVIYSDFNMWDTPRYPNNRNPGEQWA